MNKKTRNDIILICVLIAVALSVILIAGIRSEKGSFAVVILDKKEIARYSLLEDREVRIDCGNGDYNILVIKDGKASVREANCRTQRCVKSSEISSTLEFIRCAPHNLDIMIEEG